MILAISSLLSLFGSTIRTPEGFFDIQEIPIRPLDLASHQFVVFISLGHVIEEKIENLGLKAGFEAVFDFKLICLTNYAPLIRRKLGMEYFI